MYMACGFVQDFCLCTGLHIFILVLNKVGIRVYYVFTSTLGLSHLSLFSCSLNIAIIM